MLRKPIFGEEGSGLRLSLIIISFTLLTYHIIRTGTYGLFIPAILGALAFGKYLVDINTE